MIITAKQIAPHVHDALPITREEALLLTRLVVHVLIEGLARDGVLRWDGLGTFRVVEAVGSPLIPPRLKYSVRFRTHKSFEDKMYVQNR